MRDRGSGEAGTRLGDRVRRVLVAPSTRALAGGFLMAMGGPPFPPACIAAAFAGILLFASSLDAGADALKAKDTPQVSLRRAALRGWLFGFGANVVAMSFVPATITRFTDLPLAAALLALVLLALGQGAVFALCGVVAVFLQRRRVPLPLSFGVGVGASMMAPALFPWTMAAPLARTPVFLQFADVIGERGVSVLIAISAALAARAFVETGALRRTRALGAAAIWIALFLYGMARMRAIDVARLSAPHRTVGLVQQAVPPKERWEPQRAPTIVTKLWALTRIAQERGADLAIWPEAAYPYVLPNREGGEMGPFRIRGPGIGIEVMTGLLTDAPPPEGAEPGAHWAYNATTLVDREGHVAQPAAKIELLAFGEVVPLGNWFPVLRRIFARGGGLVPGADVVLLTTPSTPTVRAGVLNCYEDTLGGLARRVVKKGPNLLVNVTNDAWFGGTAEPELHLLEAIPRAIEARRDLLRAVNTGVTAHIDAAGRVVARAPREVATILIVEPALLEIGPTVYVRLGDYGWWVLLLAGTAWFAFARRRSSDRESESA